MSKGKVWMLLVLNLTPAWRYFDSVPYDILSTAFVTTVLTLR